MKLFTAPALALALLVNPLSARADGECKSGVTLTALEAKYPDHVFAKMNAEETTTFAAATHAPEEITGAPAFAIYVSPTTDDPSIAVVFAVSGDCVLASFQLLIDQIAKLAKGEVS